MTKQIYAVSGRPNIVDITDAAGMEVNKAFINLLPFTVRHIPTAARMNFPSLVISDAQSNPDATNTRLRGDCAILPAHSHDCGYAKDFGEMWQVFASVVLGKDEPDESDMRFVADEMYEHLLEWYCPFYKRNLKSELAEAGLRIGGASSFHDPTRNDWRREVAAKLGGIPGDGCGHTKNLREAAEYLPTICLQLHDTIVASA